MKTVLLLLTTDRFAFPLVHYLTEEAGRYGWKIQVAGLFSNSILDRLKKMPFNSTLSFVPVNNFRQCDQAIRKTDLVIALTPDLMLQRVIDCCLLHGKSLITPAKNTPQVALKKSQAEAANVLILTECGFAPGLDHITAKKAIDNIHTKGGKIFSFRTYHGSLIDTSCLDNPLEFKLTEPTADLINMGKDINRHLFHNHLQVIPYHQLFSRHESVEIQGQGNMTSVPEGDALYCRKLYALNEAHTFIKGKLHRKGFESLWNLMVKLGLTDQKVQLDHFNEKSFLNLLNSVLPYATSESNELRLKKYYDATDDDIRKLKWLGWFDHRWINTQKELNAAMILQHLLEKKVSLKPTDCDAVIMQHELEYDYKNVHYTVTATLFAKGKSRQESALAKAIGLTLGAAAKAYLLDNISIKGLWTPTQKEIYDPILDELVDSELVFQIKEEKFVQEVQPVPSTGIFGK